MDPLSLTASIIAVLQLTSTLTSHLNDIRNASNEQRAVAIEAGNLYSLLINLRYRVESTKSVGNPWLNQIKLIGSTGGPLDQLKTSLEELAGLSSTDRKRDKVVPSSIKWQWNKAQVEVLLQRIERLKTLIQCALTGDLFSLTKAVHDQIDGLSAEIADLKLSATQQRLRDKISDWLNAPDPSTNYNAALRRRHPGTGSWLLEHHSFQDWRNSETPSILWLHGNAGCGKTILCSTLLQHTLKSCDQATLVCYFYFDFKDTRKQKTLDFLHSLAKQCMDQVEDLSSFERVYSLTCRDGTLQPDGDMLQSFIQSSTESSNHTYIILDALDECIEVNVLLSLLEEIKAWPRVSIAATSRRKRDIEDHLFSVDHKVNIESSLVIADIEAYARHQVTNDPRLRKWSSEDREEMISTLVLKSDGMFQWVFCQLEALAKCIKRTSLKKTLVSLPKTLDDTYTRIINDIKAAEHLEEATVALRWLCFSMRPLRVSELVDALAIQPNKAFDPDERFPDPEDIKTVCSNFIIYWDPLKSNDESTLCSSSLGVVSEQSNEDDMSTENQLTSVRLSHFSVKEYLLSDRCGLQPPFTSTDCHANIGESCLGYLMHIANLGPLNHQLVQQFALIDYAARYWVHHLQALEIIPDSTMQMAFKFLKSQVSLLRWAQIRGERFLWTDRRMNFFLSESDLEHPLVYAAFTGLSDLVQMVLKDDMCNSLKDEDRTHALLQAAKSGSTAAVQVLLNNGADINAIMEENTALDIAAQYGELEVVQLLLKIGAKIESSNVLWKAANSGHEDIVRLLLSKGLSREQRSNTLGWAVSYPKILTIILETGVDVDARGFFSETPLQLAIFSHQVATVRILIHWGANVNTSSRGWGSVLNTAVQEGDAEIFQILLEAGAKYYDEDGHIQLGDFLCVAARHDYNALLKVLLDLCSNINVESQLYGPALVEAALYNRQLIVERLLSSGAEIKYIDEKYGNALQAAAIDGLPSFFLKGCNLGDRKETPGPICVKLICYQSEVSLSVEAVRGYDTVRSIDPLSLRLNDQLHQKDVWELVTGQNIEEQYLQDHIPPMQSLNDLTGVLHHHLNTEDSDELRQIMRANCIMTCEAQNPEMGLQILLDLSGRCGKTSQDYDFDDIAMSPASLHLVQILVEASADVNATQGYYGTALQAASRNGRHDIVSLLLERGALVNGNEGVFANPLQAACATFEENTLLVQTLIDAGADINASGGLFGTALQAACHRGFKNVISLLLDKGADVNIQAGRYGNALQAACASSACEVELVKLLLDAGANPGVVGGIFGSAKEALLSRQYHPIQSIR